MAQPPRENAQTTSFLTWMTDIDVQATINDGVTHMQSTHLQPICHMQLEDKQEHVPQHVYALRLRLTSKQPRP